MDWIQEKFGKNEQVAAANRRRSRPASHFGETTEQVRGHRYEVKPAELPSGEYTSITGNTALSVGPGRRRPARQAAGHARLVPDHAGQRHPARALEAQALRRPHGPGRGRDRRRRHGARRRVRRSPRRHHDVGSGRRAQERDDLARGSDRAPAPDRRHPARRSVDRPAHQDRGRRPQHGDVRPPRRGAAAGRGRATARRTASTPRSRPCASRSSTAPR